MHAICSNEHQTITSEARRSCLLIGTEPAAIRLGQTNATRPEMSAILFSFPRGKGGFLFFVIYRGL